MNRNYPIHTVEASCQDCYKCVRNCPVKAIKIENGHAAVVSELCVLCGKCVEACPAKAKRVRDGISRVRMLLDEGKAVYASLAPSWIAEFKGVEPARMAAALRSLGFAGVGETAAGAEIVSEAVAAEFAAGRRFILSTACPSAVEFVRKYHPALSSSLSEVQSPMLAHAGWLRRLRPDSAVVFIGPCVAKKLEADRRPDLVATALTFPELEKWFDDAGIAIGEFDMDGLDGFESFPASDGRLYPVEGGMLECVRKFGVDADMLSISGILEIDRALDGFNPDCVARPAFVELLACPGGCVNGPCAAKNPAGLADRLRVLDSRRDACGAPRPSSRPEPSDIRVVFEADPAPASSADERLVSGALRLIGKMTVDDELNCGGCGYETCRNFATALVSGRAEPSMCVSYLKTQAQKKANALLRCIPAGVVIVDSALKIIESNERFATMFGEDVAMAYEAKPGLQGADITRIVPFVELFRSVVAAGGELRRDMLRCDGRILNLTVFTLEPHLVVGAVLEDVTRTEMRREQIAGRAKDVIRKNLATVQEIAFRLGEHMADTEMLLRSIAEDYSAKTPPQNVVDLGGGVL